MRRPFFRSFSFALLLTLLLARVVLADAVIRTSEVSTVITMDGANFVYNYTVINTSPGDQDVFDPQTEQSLFVWPTIVDFEIPIDSPAVVLSILSPEHWSSEILSASDYETRFGEPNSFGAAFIVHWFTDEPFPIVPTGYFDRFETLFYENSTDGFLLTSPLGPVNGPYLASWEDDFRQIADPPLPGGTVGGGGTLPFSTVPEPACTLLLFAGLAVLAGRRPCRSGTPGLRRGRR
jgi:hypothetical protein